MVSLSSQIALETPPLGRTYAPSSGEEARRLGLVEEEAGVEGAGHPVRPDAEVGDDDVVVELRLERARGRVEVVRCHHSPRECRALPHAHLEGVAFGVAQSPGDGLVERLEDRGARRFVLSRPEHAHRLRDREGEVVAGDDLRRFAVLRYADHRVLVELPRA